MHCDDLHSPPQCHVSLAAAKTGQERAKPQINITASCITGPRDPLNGLLQAINYLGARLSAPDQTRSLEVPAPAPCTWKRAAEIRLCSIHSAAMARSPKITSTAGMYEGQPAQPAGIRTQCGRERQAAQQADQSPLRQHAAAAYASLLSPCGSGEPPSVPSSPPATPPRSCHKGRPGQRSPTKGLRSPTVLRAQGEV